MDPLSVSDDSLQEPQILECPGYETKDEVLEEMQT